MGSVYSRNRSPYLWIKYHQNGRAVRETTGTKNEVVARSMLRAREGDVERGIPIDPKVGRITFHEAATDMLNDYKANRKKTYIDAKRRLKKGDTAWNDSCGSASLVQRAPAPAT